MIPRAFIALFAAAAAAQDYAGSAACRPCHAAIYRSYFATPMALSTGRVGEGAFRESLRDSTVRHQASGVEYRVSAQRGALSYEFSRAGSDLRGARTLDYFVGSGAAGRSYLTLTNGFLFQSPVSYYSKAAKWDISPGFQLSKSASLSRPIETRCLQCHAGRLQPIAGTQNKYAGAPFLEAGIGCERCHGPGARHAAAPQGAIVNPARLDSARRDSVCAQCHLNGAARVARAGRGLATFRPGDLLTGHVVSFIDPNAAFKVTSHFETLDRSACKRAAGAKLWCGTCHDPHSVPEASRRAQYFRAKCVSCHPDDGCRKGPDCASCHMPKNPTSDVGHVAYTDHSIPRPGAVRPARTPGLVPFAGFDAAPREWGMAYAALFDYARALPLLESADDAEALEQLAAAYDRRNDPAKAAAAYERALKLDPSLAAAHVNLGVLYAKQGRLEAAAQSFAAALERNAGFEEAGINLGVALARLGRTGEAKAALQATLEHNPDSRMARSLLDELP